MDYIYYGHIFVINLIFMIALHLRDKQIQDLRTKLYDHKHENMLARIALEGRVASLEEKFKK